jgi:hypothetical protein
MLAADVTMSVNHTMGVMFLKYLLNHGRASAINGTHWHIIIPCDHLETPKTW